MAQIELGLRAILRHPSVYNVFQSLLGANKGRRILAEHFIKAASGDKILDIGCGTAEIVDFLPDDICYWGFDQSRQYIDFAKKRYGEKLDLNCAKIDQFSVSGLPAMNIVLAIGLLHHLEDCEVRQLVKVAKSVLGAGGKFIAIDPCFSDNQNFIARWVVGRDRGQNIRSAEGYTELVDSSFTQVTSHTIHRAWIPYTHHIMVCRA